MSFIEVFSAITDLCKAIQQEKQLHDASSKQRSQSLWFSSDDEEFEDAYDYGSDTTYEDGESNSKNAVMQFEKSVRQSSRRSMVPAKRVPSSERPLFCEPTQTTKRRLRDDEEGQRDGKKHCHDSGTFQTSVDTSGVKDNIAQLVEGNTPAANFDPDRPHKSLIVKLTLSRASQMHSTLAASALKLMGADRPVPDQFAADKENSMAQPSPAPPPSEGHVASIATTTIGAVAAPDQRSHAEESDEIIVASTVQHDMNSLPDPTAERTVPQTHPEHSHHLPEAAPGSVPVRKDSTQSQHLPAKEDSSSDPASLAPVPSTTAAAVTEPELLITSQQSRPEEHTRRSKTPPHSDNDKPYADFTSRPTPSSAQPACAPTDGIDDSMRAAEDAIAASSRNQEIEHDSVQRLEARREDSTAPNIPGNDPQIARVTDTRHDPEALASTTSSRTGPPFREMESSVSGGAESAHTSAFTLAQQGPRQTSLLHDTSAQSPAATDTSRSYNPNEVLREASVATQATTFTSELAKAYQGALFPLDGESSKASKPSPVAVDMYTSPCASVDGKTALASIETNPLRAELTPSMRASSSMPPSDTKPEATQPNADTSMIVLVDWKHKEGDVPTVSRLTRYSPNLWSAVKEDMPAAFAGKKLAGIKRGTVSMSAADALEQYGESIASEGVEDCVQFLVNTAFGEDGDVERIWRKATVFMKD